MIKKWILPLPSFSWLDVDIDIYLTGRRDESVYHEASQYITKTILINTDDTEKLTENNLNFFWQSHSDAGPHLLFKSIANTNKPQLLSKGINDFLSQAPKYIFTHELEAPIGKYYEPEFCIVFSSNSSPRGHQISSSLLLNPPIINPRRGKFFSLNHLCSRKNTGYFCIVPTYCSKLDQSKSDFNLELSIFSSQRKLLYYYRSENPLDATYSYIIDTKQIPVDSSFMVISADTRCISFFLRKSPVSLATEHSLAPHYYS